MAISAVVAVGAAGDQLVRELAANARALKVGPSLGEGVDMGPVITAEHRQSILRHIEAGVAEGADLVVDGRGLVVPEHERGFFVGPTLFDRVTPRMTIYEHEIFGPVLVVVRAATLDEAIAIVNENPYGNGTALFTRSGAAARRFEQDVQVGMVGINVPIPVPVAYYSFGGWKQSLFGDLHVHGAEGVKFYTRTKAVTRRWTGDPAGGAFHMPTPE
jgi:malonate-semialdehyde dehydrogenase (acetylating)/methylmalonate-semialdehyde dehydrogenase